VTVLGAVRAAGMVVDAESLDRVFARSGDGVVSVMVILDAEGVWDAIVWFGPGQERWTIRVRMPRDPDTLTRVLLRCLVMERQASSGVAA